MGDWLKAGLAALVLACPFAGCSQQLGKEHSGNSVAELRAESDKLREELAGVRREKEVLQGNYDSLDKRFLEQAEDYNRIRRIFLEKGVADKAGTRKFIRINEENSQYAKEVDELKKVIGKYDAQIKRLGYNPQDLLDGLKGDTPFETEKIQHERDLAEAARNRAVYERDMARSEENRARWDTEAIVLRQKIRVYEGALKQLGYDPEKLIKK